jgi:hypothetical protein
MKNSKTVTFPIVDTCLDYHDFSFNANFLTHIIKERVDYEEIGYSNNMGSYIGVYFLRSQGLDDETITNIKEQYSVDM